MSSYFIPASDRSIDILPDSLSVLGQPNGKLGRGGGLERILSTTVAMLNQTQSDLDSSKKQIEHLKQQLAELERVATTDLLTGLKNRRGFDAAFAAELDRTKRAKSIGGVLVVIDLDSFKAINDTYGHQAGDECLKVVADTLAAEIREMDTAARLGGDEFVLLLTDTNPELLLTRVQNIAWKLNHLSLAWENNVHIAINASVGMKPYTHKDNAADIFSGADKDMYADKKRAKGVN